MQWPFIASVYHTHCTVVGEYWRVVASLYESSTINCDLKREERWRAGGIFAASEAASVIWRGWQILVWSLASGNDEWMSCAEDFSLG
jgi:hypothetical protein